MSLSREILLLVSLSSLIACGETAAPSESHPGDDAGIPAGDASSGPDAAQALDAGTDPDVDAGPGTAPRIVECAARTAALAAGAGVTITVSPAGDGQVRVDGATRTLREVVSSASDGDTILLEDGTYTLPEAASGSYTGLYFRTANVTLRGASGDPSRVVLDSG